MTEEIVAKEYSMPPEDEDTQPRERADELEAQLAQLRGSLGVQLLARYGRLAEGILPAGTRRRRLYDLALVGVGVILSEGWRAFLEKFNSWFQWTALGHRAVKMGSAKLNMSAKSGLLNQPKGSQREFPSLRAAHNGFLYRCPIDLRVTATASRRALLIGSCLIESWPWIVSSHPSDPCQTDYAIFNNFPDLPDEPPGGLKSHDFHVIQLPLRTVLPDHACFRTAFDDAASHDRVLKESVDRLNRILQIGLKWSVNEGVPAFVINFMVPQQNPLGRLLPRYDLSNPAFLVEQLNQALSAELQRYPNAHLVDMDDIVATFGKKYFQDDGVVQINHSAGLANSPWDQDHARIEATPPMSEHYYLRKTEIVNAVWAEIVAMYRTLRQVDQVKLVAIDLDDTLWRGVVAEEAGVGPDVIEGWPLGIVEALSSLKNRGVLLAVISKNDESRVTAFWKAMMRGRLSLDDFAFRRINWRSKAENMEEILQEANLLPRSVVFVDDNPRERAEMHLAFPEIRILGSYPYYLRRILLWSAETQVPTITRESGRRTEMMQAQVRREDARRQLSREDFLSSLQLRVHIERIVKPEGPRFVRAVELLNKTNQFNTTGRRRSAEECRQAIDRGERLYAFDVEDQYTNYGLVGVIWVDGATIDQWAMSCRVLGMDVEQYVMARIVADLRNEGVGRVSGRIVETDANLASRELFKICGFEAEPSGVWSLDSRIPIKVPSHIVLT